MGENRAILGELWQPNNNFQFRKNHKRNKKVMLKNLESIKFHPENLPLPSAEDMKKSIYILVNLKYYEKHKDIFEEWEPVIVDSPEHHKFKEDMGKINIWKGIE